MRTFSTALLLALLALSPALAAPKTTIQNPPCAPLASKERVGVDTPGYRSVEVQLVINVPADTSPSDVAKKGVVVFGIYMPATSARLDRDGLIMGIGACERETVSPQGRFYPAGTVWYRVRLLVKEVGEGNFTLAGDIPLPEDVVAKKPRAETLLKSGVPYRGAWIEEGNEIVLRLEPNS